MPTRFASQLEVYSRQHKEIDMHYRTKNKHNLNCKGFFKNGTLKELPTYTVMINDIIR